METKLRIDAYSFGQIDINGRKVTSDLMIFPDGTVREKWRRTEGHRLTLEDMQDLVTASPEAIIVGTGHSGKMQAERDLAAQLKEKSISVEFMPTGSAINRLNALLLETKRVGACFHLTC